MAEDALVWVYCVAGGDVQLPDATGVDGRHRVESVGDGRLTAVVSRVPASEFGADALPNNLNQMEWLERVARTHARVLELVLAGTTIVPLRMCTLYESVEGVRQMLAEQRATLAAALDALAGRKEWSVKLLVDEARLEEVAQSRAAAAAGLSPDSAGQSAGGAYLMRRRLEREAREEAHALAASVSETLRLELAACALDMVTRPAQNPKLSGLRGRMILNAALLVDTDRVDRLHALATSTEANHAYLGAEVVITGPWPPYNFVSGNESAALA